MSGVIRYRAIVTIVFIIMASLRHYHIVESRAIMVEPPHRSSLWRFNYNTPENVRDDSLNCGGFDWQWGVHNGRCGICGDRWNGTQHNDDRGMFDSGIIVRQYTDGHYVNITFEVSSNYLGYVEFRLCPRNSTDVPLEQSCFDRYPLWIDESHGTRYYVGSRGGIYDIHIRLPGGLVCKKCVIQWKYKTGYRYNGDDTCKCLGCGRQEQYVNCADIEIAPTHGWPTPLEPTQSGPGSKPGMAIPEIIQPTRASQRGQISTVRKYYSSLEGSLPSLQPTPAFNLQSLSIYIGPASASTVSPRINVSMVSKMTSTLNITITPTPVTSSYEMSSTSVGTPTVLFTPPPEPSMPQVRQQAALTLDAIRREIVKKLGSEVQSGMKIFFSPPKETRRPQVFTRPVTTRPRFDSFPVAPQKPEVPNTQFVSVSNILDRFYPNYITPLLFSLAQPSTDRQSSGCDVTSDEFRCKARGIYQKSPGISKWCEINCRASNCVTFMCECSCEDKTKTQNTSCHAIADFQGVEGMDQWCSANCKVGYCPANTCSVETCMPKSLNGEV